MASLVNDPNGTRRIQFLSSDRKRKTIRLGKISKKDAESVRRHVEMILAAQLSGQPLPRETAVWLDAIGEQLKEKLAAVDLIVLEERFTVEQWLTQWIEGRVRAGHKPTSIRTWRQTVDLLIRLFGHRRLESICHADAETFLDAMADLRPSTRHKRLGHAKTMWGEAARQFKRPHPWEHASCKGGNPSERRTYVSNEDIHKVIEHCPNLWWRLLVAFARYTGMRVPSEPFSLRWGDIDWGRGRIVLESPKTGIRTIPIFPLLRPHLEAAWDATPEGTEFVMPEDFRQRAAGADGWAGANLRTTLAKVVRRAGLTPWPRIWHALRASCESDLAANFPLAVVTKWIGNTQAVAMRHYIDTTDSSFDAAQQWTPPPKAAQKAAHSEAISDDLERSPKSETSQKQGEFHTTSGFHCDTQTNSRKRMGIEPTSGGDTTR
ncbi:integrase family protein : Phage integrase family protein OS=Rhodopirellula maiorica SM1 GN=RMSM_04392 PE=4 SV=1: Phage_integrase [Tuwongella immobilis]|uniref:Tyr recombinase domain-containing protein n=1 Tax=Tuwongella immobilis TaxID=692036 RepID=A0A6C2YL86_9BACT|nr:integrase family protein : Phage integrase family protein OS=Rhodopirellula maiorica SM1 GN=RMSM_04392 PE=4 SV=1: Phage_integrase [Tuwongella immobilis]VTS00497.1 integrase family protein : Phage integrase family protein OS=Rhodopirellula maiorica SM1 GN=RMSM_04392 PE=4 SV=1: Phage_integrase [Tuwongella immobilis]